MLDEQCQVSVFKDKVFKLTDCSRQDAVWHVFSTLNKDEQRLLLSKLVEASDTSSEAQSREETHQDNMQFIQFKYRALDLLIRLAVGIISMCVLVYICIYGLFAYRSQSIPNADFILKVIEEMIRMVLTVIEHN